MAGFGIETDDLFQQAILWPASEAIANTDGSARLDPSVDISARWAVDVNSVGNQDSDATQAVGKVYVDREVPINSILRKGCKANPGAEQLYEVLGYFQRDDVFGEESRRWVTVGLWHGTLPDGV